MIRRDLLQSLPLSVDRFGIEPEITARLAQAGARIRELPVSYDGRSYAEGEEDRLARRGSGDLVHCAEQPAELEGAALERGERQGSGWSDSRGVTLAEGPGATIWLTGNPLQD